MSEESTPRIATSRCSREAGFNLIEVTLAVAIAGIALITILGLIPTGIESARRVSDDTLVTLLASDMLHWRRITPWDKQPWFPSGAPAMTSSRPTTPVVAYLDAMGNLDKFEDAITTNPYYTGKYFKFTYVVKDSPTFPGSFDAGRVLITVEWPCNPITGNPVTNPNRRYFVSEYTRLQ